MIDGCSTDTSRPSAWRTNEMISSSSGVVGDLLLLAETAAAILVLALELVERHERERVVRPAGNRSVPRRGAAAA